MKKIKRIGLWTGLVMFFGSIIISLFFPTIKAAYDTALGIMFVAGLIIAGIFTIVYILSWGGDIAGSDF